MWGILEAFKSILDIIWFLFMCAVLVFCIPMLWNLPAWVGGSILIGEHLGFLADKNVLTYALFFLSVVVISMVGVVALMYVGALLHMEGLKMLIWSFVCIIIMYSIPIRFYHAAHPSPTKVEAPITMQADKAVEAYSIP